MLSRIQELREPPPVARQLLMPKNVKYRKPHKPAVKPFRHSTKWKFKGFAIRCNKPHFGKYALQVLEEAWVNNRTIEAVRRCIVRQMERKGKVWIRVFPHSGITDRGKETRFGAGKAGIKYWCQAVRPHYVLFEMDGVTEDVARLAMTKAMHKLPCKSRFVIKKDGPSQFELGLAGKAGKKVVEWRGKVGKKK